MKHGASSSAEQPEDNYWLIILALVVFWALFSALVHLWFLGAFS